MNSLRKYLLIMGRSKKLFVLLFLDAIILSGSLWISMAIRLGAFNFPRDERLDALYFILPIVGVGVLWMLGLYRLMVRSFEGRTILLISLGALITAFCLPLNAFIDDELFLPRSVPIVYFLLVVIGISGSRIALRELYLFLLKNHAEVVRVVIYGAGATGQQLAGLLANLPNYRLVAFIDDNPKLTKVRIGGKPVLQTEALPQFVESHGISDAMIAIQSISSERKRDIARTLTDLKLKVRVVPSFGSVVGDEATIDNLEPVKIEDLLGREQIEPLTGLLQEGVGGKNILVTGASGSIGSELCRQILTFHPKKLIVFDVSEIGLYNLEKELLPLTEASGVELHIAMGSILDAQLLRNMFAQHDINLVYHAAAYKHVPIVENNPLVAVSNNVLGTRNVVDLAIEFGVGRFVLVSTDKAVRPTSVMGATKRLAELVVQDRATRAIKKGIILSMVRFGNVLGSSGSVIPLFEKQIASGGPVTLTHPKVTRYFMTIEEAAQLIVQAGFMAKGGDVFVLDMGKPVLLLDLATQMIKLSGKDVKFENDEKEYQDSIELKVIGLRPGEKLYEELLIGDNVSGTRHPKIMRAVETKFTHKETSKMLDHINDLISEADKDGLGVLLKKFAHLTDAATLNEAGNNGDVPCSDNNKFETVDL